MDQAHIEAVVLDRILAAWLSEAVLIEGLLPDSLRQLDSAYPHHWFWDGHEHVDPSKEANAQATRLASHTTTLADEYARKGQDWETALRQRAKEVALMKELGLEISTSPSSNAPPADTAADENADPDKSEDANEPADAE